MNGNFGGGNGTVNSPYLVEDIKDLNAVRNNLAAFYLQTQDIEFNGSGWDITGWTPIGDTTTAFTGGYDGGNKKIRNLYIASSSIAYQGLFGRANGIAFFKNIILENVDITRNPSTFAGALVGLYDNSGTGIGYIDNCHAAGYIRCDNGECGGLIGKVTNGSTNERTITGCSSSGYVYGNYAGGIVGSIVGSKCRFRGCYSTAQIYGIIRVGGFVGQLSGCDYIQNCFAKGAVKGQSQVGGFCGYQVNASTITNCYSTGKVTATVATGECGGFIGYAYANLKLTYCYSIGKVTGNGATNVGGFIGRISNMTFYDACLWDTQTSGMNTSAAWTGSPSTGYGATGLTTAEMTQKSTYTGNGWSI